MDLSQAIECASAFVFPGFLADDASLAAERSKNEEALAVLRDACPRPSPATSPLAMTSSCPWQTATATSATATA